MEFWNWNGRSWRSRIVHNLRSIRNEPHLVNGCAHSSRFRVLGHVFYCILLLLLLSETMTNKSQKVIRPPLPEVETLPLIDDSQGEEHKTNNGFSTSPPMTPRNDEDGEDEEKTKKRGSNFRRVWRSFKLVWPMFIQLMLVYFFEYVVMTGCANKSQISNYEYFSEFFLSFSLTFKISREVYCNKKTISDWAICNHYKIFSFCYQACYIWFHLRKLHYFHFF